VANDNGGTATASLFNLYVKISGIDVGGSPVAGAEAPGISYSLPAGTYVVSEDTNVSYTSSFSGDCDSNGSIVLAAGEEKTCLITNNDIVPVITPTPPGNAGPSWYSLPPVPPLIDVVKISNPLALPGGFGPVMYTYTLRNIGIVPVINVTMVDDTCSSVTLVSGDVNSDAGLDVNETWTYRCSTTLSATHTNTVVAMGWANGLSTIDIANATVVVGTSVVPPLIHVTKIPSPLTLLVGGGTVIYTERITNPGIVSLNNVNLIDDKCSPLNIFQVILMAI
jgi:hypothetical protein